jgi:uncharacterized repeat protein (TIGR01451 family)
MDTFVPDLLRPLAFVLPLMAVLVTITWFAGARDAGAAVPAAGWMVDAVANPTSLAPSGTGTYEVEARNVGSVATNGEDHVRIEDILPAGVTAESIELYRKKPAAPTEPPAPEREQINYAPLASCTSPPATGAVDCVLPSEEELSTVPPEGARVLVIHVSIDAGASGSLTNEARVSGGGAREVSTTQTSPVSTEPASFGFANFAFHIAGVDGISDTQASGHPYDLTTLIDFNTEIETEGTFALPEPNGVEYPKDLIVDLPLGLAGDTLAAPQCTLAQLASHERCPRDTAVGYLTTEPAAGVDVESPIWNLVPEYGTVAEFGFADSTPNPHVFYAHVVPGPEGYVLQVTTSEITQIVLSRIVVSFFGDPAARDESGNSQVPLLTNPSDCTNHPLRTTIYMDSWQHPGERNADGSPDLEGLGWVKANAASPPVTGCNELQFLPELFAQPTTHEADAPSGLEFEEKIPQVEETETASTPAQRDATVTLPEGMTVNPSAANGLQACSESQIGWQGKSPFDFNARAPECPEASKLASLEVKSPLIANTLSGAVYLAKQNENPSGGELAGYVVINDPATGVLVKIAGELRSDPHTGRITGIFPENPQLPFSDLKLHFFGGARGSLATPKSCGTYTTTSNLEAWSAPDSGPNATPFDSFQINEACTSSFAPTFTAGAANPQAGVYSPLVVSFSRSDSEQELAGASVSLPPGLTANLKGVPLCPEAQANAGSCPESTQIGTVQAGAGVGPDPIFVSGKAYLTGPYNGGSYGLSVVVPAIAGPFNLGDVIVRQALHIDPTDGHVTDVSDPFPTVLDVTGPNGQTDGFPIKMRRVDVNINRPAFSINPTNCAKLQINDSLSSTAGTNAGQLTPFQVGNCANLKFAPKLTVTTSAHTSKTNGASLNVKLTYPPYAPGVYTNVAKVKTDLPRALPSRLTTLHGACLAAVFNANPANCSPVSIVGHATAIVPNLAAPLEGPAYLVSHGNEAFPALTLVLQGDNITVDLVGATFIHNGVTSTTFRTVPDNPVTSFEVNLPEGPHSILAALTNLCKTNLQMPTAFVAQNGAEIHQSTHISTTGCKATNRTNKKHSRRKSHVRHK